jgi:hypothetical protein
MRSDNGSLLATRERAVWATRLRGGRCTTSMKLTAPRLVTDGGGHARQGRRPLVDSETGPDLTRASDHQNLYLRTV